MRDPRKLLKRILPGLGIVGLALALGNCGGAEGPKQMPPPALPVVGVTVQEVPIEKEFVGQVYGFYDIPIRARVVGYLEGIHFNEGFPVKQGQLLYTIDPQPFEQAVAAAQSQLAESKIRAINAKSDLDRIVPLAKINAVSKSDLDAANASYDAAVEGVKAANANLRISEIELSYTRIQSPINGLIGKTNAKVGEFVGQDPNPVILNTVSRIDSVRVEFFLTEADYLRFAKEAIERGLDNNEAARPLRLVLGDGSIYEYTGKTDFIDRDVDPETGALLVQATFPNPKGLIRPGQFAKIRAIVTNIENGLLIPQRCVTEIQGNHFVMLVGDSGVVKQQSVQLGEKYKDYWLVQEGLEKDSRIVFEGLQKVREGMKINPQDTVFQSKFPD